jgi:hypothetical protein
MQLGASVIGIFLMAVTGTASADCRNGTPEQFELQKAKTLADPIAQVTEENGYLKVRLPQSNGDLVTSYFTQPEHPAHPSNVVSAIYESEGAIWLYSRGFTAGDCVPFEHWMQGFAEQQERIRQAIQAKVAASDAAAP